MEELEQFLRMYRENILKRSRIGFLALCFFERIYYSFSPKVARWIEHSFRLTTLTRVFVADPIIDILMLGVYFFRSGRRLYRFLDKDVFYLKLGIFLRGIGGMLYSGGWLAWNACLVSPVRIGIRMLFYAALCWLAMGPGLLLMHLGNSLHAKIHFTPSEMI